MSFLSPFAGLVVGTGGEGEGGEQGFVVSSLFAVADRSLAKIES